MDSDSDFYGEEEEIHELESRVTTFDPTSYWRSREVLATASPAMSIKQESGTSPHSPSSSAAAAAATKLHNPYEGKPSCAKQLNETIDVFLSRLPPATTDVAPDCPWIYVANPFIPREDRGGEEAPAEFGAQLGKFVEGGEARLEMFGDLLREVQEKTAGSSQSGRGSGGPSKTAVNREVAKQREGCVNDILMLAKVLKVRTGKWMLFIEPAFVNEVWATVARATVKNELGIAAKVAPRAEKGSPKERLVCIYTYDFSDRDDIARVLGRMKQLDLVRTGPGRKPIYYKADAYTYLGIGSGNPWGLRASIYSSKDIFADIQQKDGKAPAREIKKEKLEDDEAWTF